MAVSPFSPAPAWFRILAWIGLAWNAIGVFMYLSAVGVLGDPMAGMSEAERQAAASIPPWVMGAFAIGTFAGLVGSLGLILRRRWARALLFLSLLALVLLEGWILFFSDAVEEFGVAVPVTVVVGAVLLAWLGGYGARRRWLA